MSLIILQTIPDRILITLYMKPLRVNDSILYLVHHLVLFRTLLALMILDHKVLADHQIVLSIKRNTFQYILGKPAPLATWVCEGGLPDEATVTTTEESTTLAIETAESKHAGTYGLVLENEYGAQTAAFKVVLDSEKSGYMSTSEIMEEHYKEASFSKKPPAAINVSNKLFRHDDVIMTSFI